MKSDSKSAPKLTARRIGVTLVALMLATALLPGLVALTTIDGFSENCATIRGIVTEQGEDDEGEPVGGIAVTAYPRGQSSAVGSPVTSTDTDGEGNYELEVSAGGYIVAISDPGYVPAMFAPEILECEDEAVVDFELESLPLPDLPDLPSLEDGNLEVTVNEVIGSESSRPTSGIDVEAWNGPCTIPAHAMPADSNTTNEEGEVSFTLQGGTYCIRAGADDFTSAEAEVSVSETQAALLVLEVEKTNLRNFEGRISDESSIDPLGVVGATVTMEHGFYCPDGEKPDGVSYKCVFTTNDEGGSNFETDGASERMPWAIGDDHYTMKVEHPSYVTDSVDVAIQPGTTGRHTEDLGLIRAFTTLSGTLDDATGGDVTLDGHFTGVSKTTALDEEGSFDFTLDDDLPADSYQVTFEDDGENVLGYLCITLDGSDRVLEGVTQDATHDISGQVFDHDEVTGLVGAVVKVIPEVPLREGDECYARTGANGDYSIGLPSGDYDISVSKPDWVTSDTIGLGDEGSEDLEEIVLERITGNIRGTVEEELIDGSVSVEGAVITCTHDDLDLEFEATTEGNGDYDIEAPHGPYECSATHEHFTDDGPESLTVVAGRNNNNNDFLLERIKWVVSGSVLDAVSGEPLEGASVCVQNLAALEGELTCDRSDEDGTYSIALEFEAFGPDMVPADLNPVIAVATQPGYSVGIKPAVIGPDSVSALPPTDFELISEQTADDVLVCAINNLATPEACVGDPPVPDVPDVPDVPGGEEEVMEMIPEELNCRGHERVLSWLNQLIASPFCGEDPELPEGTVMDLIPEELNCRGHDNILSWVNQMIANPFCGEDPELPIP